MGFDDRFSKEINSRRKDQNPGLLPGTLKASIDFGSVENGAMIQKHLQTYHHDEASANILPVTSCRACAAGYPDRIYPGTRRYLTEIVLKLILIVMFFQRFLVFI